MPIYEYRCQDCRARVSIFLRSFASESSPTCHRCGGRNLARLVSSFAVVKSEGSRMEDMESQSWLSDVDENDPKSMVRWMRHMQRETGEDMGPEFDEAVDMMEAGEMPEDMDEGDGGLEGGLLE